MDAYGAAGRSHLQAVLDIRAGISPDLFGDWLEGGLRMVEGCKPGGRIWRAMREEGRP